MEALLKDTLLCSSPRLFHSVGQELAFVTSSRVRLVLLFGNQTLKTTDQLVSIAWCSHSWNPQDNWFDFFLLFLLFSLIDLYLGNGIGGKMFIYYRGNVLPCKPCPLLCQPNPQRCFTTHTQVYSRHR